MTDKLTNRKVLAAAERMLLVSNSHPLRLIEVSQEVFADLIVKPLRLLSEKPEATR